MIIDAAVNWGPNGPAPTAPGFDVEARKDDVTSWVRQVRGGILAGAFTVERHLSAAIVYYILGERVKNHEVQDVFDEGILSPMTFERRINVAMLIAAHFFDAETVKEMSAELTALKTLRNAMAHKPFWFHPELNDDGEVANIVPIVMRGKGPLPLTTAFIEETNQKMQSLIAQSLRLEQAAVSRIPGSKVPAPAPKQSPS